MNSNLTVVALVAGVVGVATGVMAVVLSLPVLGLIAGAGALVAAACAHLLGQMLSDSTDSLALMESEMAGARAEPLPVRPLAGGPRTGSATSSDATDDTKEAKGSTPDGGPSEASTNPGSVPAERRHLTPLGDDQEEALIDRFTGLFSEKFFMVALESRIAAARRHLRPVALVLVDVVEGLPAGEPTPIDASLVAASIKDTLRDSDTACRLETGHFALLLEDTPENGAIWTVERIRRQLTEGNEGATVWAGVACYPAHAFSPDEMITAAEQALVSAREWRQDRIEVAIAAD